MPGIYKKNITGPNKFIVALELVPGRESTGRSIDTVIGIAKDAYKDGRLPAVSITDNPGGNPSLSPDVLGMKFLIRGWILLFITLAMSFITLWKKLLTQYSIKGSV